VEIILLEKVRKLGLMGDLVKVKSGFARNFLLPNKKALRATKENLEHFKKQKQIYQENNIKLKNEAGILSKKIQEEIKLTLIRHAGRNNQLYGSVTARDISEAITQHGFPINRSQIIMKKAIKTIGIHTVIITLHPEIETNIELQIARSKEEANNIKENNNTKADNNKEDNNNTKEDDNNIKTDNNIKNNEIN
jgi:large subunit ribosomal protein L9